MARRYVIRPYKSPLSPKVRKLKSYKGYAIERVTDRHGVMYKGTKNHNSIMVGNLKHLYWLIRDRESKKR